MGIRSLPLAAGLTGLGLLLLCVGCGNGSKGGADGASASRPFLMGSTPFFASADLNRSVLPDWRFENLEERDLLSLHVDDFLGVPWDYCDAVVCDNLPTAWLDRWRQLSDDANATGKLLYLALSPLGDRRTLAPRVLPDGTTEAHWNSSIDASGCYLFDSDSEAAAYKSSYITYLKYIIDMVGPQFVSPAVEINLPFTSCPAQKSAWIAWYNEVQATIKTAYPQLAVFPTFQLEAMYGVNNSEAACGSGTLEQCFDQRLLEALAIPADRIAFSTYPLAWSYNSEFNYSFPRNTYVKVAQVTARRIWISETGWAASPVRTSYAHADGGSCGGWLFPSSLEIPGLGTFDFANETAQRVYISWLLTEAKNRNFEAVVWWLNRDYLDDALVGSCPCTPADSSTCLLAEQFYAVGGDAGEMLLRMFGNMALRRYDGSPRPGAMVWHDYATRRYRP